jgi:hypothetical protein
MYQRKVMDTGIRRHDADGVPIDAESRSHCPVHPFRESLRFQHREHQRDFSGEKTPRFQRRENSTFSAAPKLR